MVKITKSANETIALGKKFAKTLKGGEVVLLIGGLGSGKTTFVKGIAQGLGIKKNITSPTFVLMKVYLVKNGRVGGEQQTMFKDAILSSRAPQDAGAGDILSKQKGIPRLRPAKCGALLGMTIKKLVHIDTYRGLSLADLKNIGTLEYFGRKDTVCFVEWGAKLEKYLMQNSIVCIKIKIKILSENERRFEIKKAFF